MMDTLAVTAGITGMAGVPLRVASAVAVGMPGCAYLLLEGFLLTARAHRRALIIRETPWRTRRQSASSPLPAGG